MLSKPNILVCTDFSSYSDLAIKAGEEIRKKTNGVLQVLHVSEHPVIWDWLPKEDFPIYFDAKFEVELMNAHQLKLQDQLRACGVEAQIVMAMGVPVTVINQEIIDRKTDLIIMGHKGKSNGSFQIGSLTERIVATASIPVLVVKKPLKMDKMAALVDPSDTFEHLLNSSEELSYLFNCSLTVVSLLPDLTSRYVGMGKLGFSQKMLNLSPDQKDAVSKVIQERMAKHLSKYSPAKFKIEVSSERKLAYHLNSILTEGNIDIAVMQRHQSGFLEKVLIGSETRRMLEIYGGNLFILPPP